jgi:hypothetical protein
VTLVFLFHLSLRAQGVVWNLGCVFAEMLFNKPLFTSRTRNGMYVTWLIEPHWFCSIVAVCPLKKCKTSDRWCQPFTKQCSIIRGSINEVYIDINLKLIYFMVAVLREDVFMKYLQDCSRILECPKSDCFGNVADALRGIFLCFSFRFPISITRHCLMDKYHIARKLPMIHGKIDVDFRCCL